MPHAIAGTCQVLKGRDERMDRREESSLASRMSQVHSAAPLVKASHVEHSGGGGGGTASGDSSFHSGHY